MDIQLLAQSFYEYSLHMRGYSPDTVRRYRNIINFYCKSAGVQTIDQVSKANVFNLFFVGRTARKWAAETFISYHDSLLVFFRWCMQRGHLKENPMDGLELPKREKRLRSSLTRQDALRLLEVVYNYPYESTYARYRNHAIFSTFLYAGLRRRELLKLRLTDVDLDNLTVFVYQGKGSKDRIIPMSHSLAQSLRKYLEERKKMNKTCPELFSSLSRNYGLTVTGIENLMRRMSKASGIKFSAHKLRHTFATLMLEGGCDIYSLSKMMGHSDIKTTTVYLHATAEHLRSQMFKHPLNAA